jgi:hypothetical protein
MKLIKKRLIRKRKVKSIELTRQTCDSDHESGIIL